MLFRTFFIALFLQLSLFSCADYWNPLSVEYLFLNPRDGIFLQYSEDLNESATYNNIISNYEKLNKKENIKEWQDALNNKFSTKEIEDFLYNKKNLENLQDKEFLDYINFTQAQEPCVTYSYFKPKPDDCTKYIPEAISNLENTNNLFLKQRYFYLALRLAHYNKQEPLKIYEKYAHLLKDSNSIVKDWVQALYAGALIKDNQKEKGVYEFSKLFDTSINSHLALYNFFHIKSQDEFDTLIGLTKNSEEKIKIYTLRALDNRSNIIEELENIYKIDKNSKWLDYLLYRELLKSQTFFNNRYSSNKIEENPFFNKYLTFLNSIEKKDMYLVNLSKVYFNIYTKNYDVAKKLVNKLQNQNQNSHEIKVASYIVFLNNLEKIDKQTEDEIFSKLETLLDENHHSSSIYTYSLRILENLYAKQGLNFDSFLMRNSLYLNYSSFDLENFEKFEKFLETPQTTNLKKFIQAKLKQQVENSYEDFKETKLAVLINNLDFKKALEFSKDSLEVLEYNPFNISIRGNNRGSITYSLTKVEFLRKILMIQNNLEKNPKNIMNNFLFANAMFNLSYFGNSSKVSNNYRSISTFYTPKLQEEKLNLALKHYKIALKQSQDQELKAKILYQIAKTKLALFDLNYEAYPQNYSWHYSKDKKYYYSSDKFYEDFLENGGKKYFDELNSKYKNTKYYKEILRECSDFRTYINSK